MKYQTQIVNTNSDVTSWALPEGAISRWGRGVVHNIAFDSVNNLLAVGSLVGLWLYDISTLAPIELWETERGMILALDFSPNGQWLATGNADGTIKVWDVQQGVCVTQTSIRTESWPPDQLAFSSDNQYIAASSSRNGYIFIWNVESGNQIAKFSSEPVKTAQNPRPAPLPLCFSLDGHLLACTDKSDKTTHVSNSISVWHVTSGKRIAYLCGGHTTQISALCFSPCGQFLASGDVFGTLKEWDITTEKQVRMSNEFAERWMIPCYTHSGTLFVAGECQSRITVWDADHCKKLGTFEYHGNTKAFHFSSVEARSNNKSRLVLAVANQLDFKVWTSDNPNVATSISYHSYIPNCVKFSSDGNILVCVGFGTAACWNVPKQTRTEITRTKTKIHSVHITATGVMLAMGSIGNTVYVWNVGTHETVAALTLHKEIVGRSSVAFAPTDDHWVSWGKSERGGNLYVWDSKGNQTVLSEHRYPPKAMLFHPYGNQLVSASIDKTGEVKIARIWDVASKEELCSLPLTSLLDADLYIGKPNQIQRWCESLAKDDSKQLRNNVAIEFSPCGTLIAAGIYGEIRLWNVPTYDIRMAILLPQSCQKPYALTFSPCGRYLASGSWWTGTEKVSIRLWDVTTGKNIAVFWGHPTDIQDLAFSPDGKILASGSYDGTILLWDMKPYLRNT